MSAWFHDRSLLQDNYFIRISNGGEAVSNHNGRSTGRGRVKGVLDHLFGGIIEGGGRLI